MWILAAAFIVFTLFTSYVLPWLNHTRIAELRRRLEGLEETLSSAHAEPTEAATAPVSFMTPPAYERSRAEEQPAKPVSQPQPIIAKPVPEGFAAEQAVPGLHKKPAEQTQPGAFEQQFGGRLFVWLGGVALALAGFFLVKYSIESGLLTEKVRVILGLIFGVGLLIGSQIVRSLPKMADSTRISQALAGAGIADLYGCFFAATTLYHLMPSWFGFGCMAATTGLALVMSLRYGAPIAALGLIGGYVTPMLIHGEPNMPILFGYLFLVFAALSFVIRRQSWWGLAIPASFTAFLWVIAMLANGLVAADAMCLVFFLLGISAVTVLATRDLTSEDPLSLLTSVRFITLGGSLLLLVPITGAAQFGLFDWYMFGLFSAAAIALAAFDERTYSFAPWLAAAVAAVTLIAWDNADLASYAAVTGTFGLLFAASSYALARVRKSAGWAALSASAAFGYFLIAYARLATTLPQVLGMHETSADALWGAIAFALAVLFAAATVALIGSPVDKTLRSKMQSTFSIAASSFLFTGFAILLHQDYLAFAIAGEVLTISWLNTKTDIPALRPLTGLLAAIFGVLILPDVTHITSAPFASQSIRHDATILAASIPSLLFQFGLPAIMFAVASEFLRKQKDGSLVSVLELGAIALFGVVSYRLLGKGLGGYSPETAFAARAMYTDILLFISFAALALGTRYKRPATILGGVLMGGLALARIGGLDLLINDPLWTHEMVGGWPVVNGLALAYALPAILIYFIGKELVRAGYAGLAATSKVIALLLVFIFVSFDVRQFYHGAYIDGAASSLAEIYTYSAMWLLLGIALLLAGTVRQDRMMRTASLLVMLLTVGKVFFYDASELTGLWRVFSFFGLGLSLLGLSWFYSRFVFTIKKPEPRA